MVFDRALVRQHRTSSAAQFGDYAYLHARALDDLLDRVCLITRDFETCLIMGAGPALADALDHHDARAKMKHIITADLSEARLRGSPYPSLCLDEERLPLGEARFDLIISVLHLHWTNDPVGALIQMNYALKPDSFFASALLGGKTLHELRHALHATDEAQGRAQARRISPFADTMDFAQLLSRAGFNMPVSDIDRVNVRFGNAFSLMRDLRGMGETNALIERPREVPSRDYFLEASARYHDQFGHEDGKIPATFEIIHGAAWAPHPDQPKPKRPGSAKVSLAEALGTQEISAGDKAG